MCQRHLVQYCTGRASPGELRSPASGRRLRPCHVCPLRRVQGLEIGQGEAVDQADKTGPGRRVGQVPRRCRERSEDQIPMSLSAKDGSGLLGRGCCPALPVGLQGAQILQSALHSSTERLHLEKGPEGVELVDARIYVMPYWATLSQTPSADTVSRTLPVSSYGNRQDNFTHRFLGVSGWKAGCLEKRSSLVHSKAQG